MNGESSPPSLPYSVAFFSSSLSQVLDALVGSGLLVGQLKAVQLSVAAHRQGHLRLTSVSASDWTATAYTYGAAFVTTLRWLAEIR
jgi:hypothetical protein